MEFPNLQYRVSVYKVYITSHIKGVMMEVSDFGLFSPLFLLFQYYVYSSTALRQGNIQHSKSYV